MNSDRSYNLVIHKPTTIYYLKQAAGIQKGRIKKGTSNNPSFQLDKLKFSVTIAIFLLVFHWRLTVEIVKTSIFLYSLKMKKSIIRFDPCGKD